LAKEFQVSRPTLREALKMLQKEGMIVSKNGVGTYVNEKTAVIENPLNKLDSLGEMIKNAGYSQSEAGVIIYRQDPLPEWKQKLEIDEPVVILERTRTADGQSVAFYYNIFPVSIVGNHLDMEFKDSVFHFLETKMGIYVSRCITEIYAPNRLNPMDRRAIGILGKEIIVLHQLHFNDKNQPIFFSIDYLKSGFIKLIVQRER
jgi:Transcriptional regulators